MSIPPDPKHEPSPIDLSALALSREEATQLLLRVERAIASHPRVELMGRGWLGLRRPVLQRLAVAAMLVAVFEGALIARMTEHDERASTLVHVYEQAVVQGQALSAEQMYRAQFWSKP